MESDERKGTMTTETAKELIQFDIQTIYHLPSGYDTLEEYIKPGGRYSQYLRKTLLDILQYCNHLEAIAIWKHMYVFALSNKYLTEEVRKRTTWSTSNRHFNLLCAMKLLHKMKQPKDDMIWININKQEFMKDNPNWHAINVFALHRYTEEYLEEVEDRCKRLKKAHITTGKIFCDKLLLRGCEDIATEVYWSNERETAKKRSKEYEVLLDRMENLIEVQKYFTKEDLYNNTPELSNYEIDRLFKIWDDEIYSEPYAKYRFKRPNKKERAECGITEENKDKWIFLPRKKEGV